jgi:PTH2 family peptidyl-tRNA hydrolase
MGKNEPEGAKLEIIPFKDVMNHKMVIVVRKDIGMDKGKIAAQASHAAVSCAIKTYKDNRLLYDLWYLEGQKKVVVKVDSLEELEKIAKIAGDDGLICVMIQDAGRTQLEPGTVTCIGIGPDKSSKIDAVAGHLKLL